MPDPRRSAAEPGSEREPALPVTLAGTRIGELVRQSDGRALLRWSSEAETRWGLNSPVLSRSLRVGFATAEQTESFFGALLPEGQHLERLARETRVPSDDLVGLLAEVGADLAGALRVGAAREPSEPEPLTAEAIDALLAAAPGFLVGGGGSALPGFQRKLTLTRERGRWLRGNGTLPSTHILKPVEREQRAAVEAEHYVLSLARELGLAEFETSVETIGSRAVLVVERYDRRRAGERIERLHQEDAAQALGLPWGGNEKFEFAEPRANLRAVAGLLDTNRTIFNPAMPDRERLLRYTVFNVAVGNTDAHAKNFSLLHTDDGGVSLAPYYDAAPLALAFEARQGLAMRVNGQAMLPEVTADDLAAEGVAWGLGEATARELVDSTLEAIIAATRRVPAHESIHAHVPGYVRGQAQNLLAGRRARLDTPVPPILMPQLGTQPRPGAEPPTNGR